MMAPDIWERVDQQRFWSKIGVPQKLSSVPGISECWPWTGYITPKGYAKYGRQYVHRMMFEEHYGPVPEGKEVDHICSVRHCVRWSHLQAITHLENIQRGRNMCSEKQQCPKGHDYDIFTTQTSKRTGKVYEYRRCSKCINERKREARKKKR